MICHRTLVGMGKSEDGVTVDIYPKWQIFNLLVLIANHFHSQINLETKTTLHAGCMIDFLPRSSPLCLF